MTLQSDYGSGARGAPGVMSVGAPTPHYVLDQSNNHRVAPVLMAGPDPAPNPREQRGGAR